MNTYILNNTSRKIELHFEYADYQALSHELKTKIKSAFLFSRFASAWVSRTKSPNNGRAENIAKELKLEYAGEQGEKLTFAEQKEREQAKASIRAERMEERAERAENESDAQYKRSHAIVNNIPMGQPILVGHHSEGRHRGDLKKADNAMRKSCEADEKAAYYRNRAEASKTTAGGRIMDEGYLVNKIKEVQASTRKLQRYLKGEGYVNRETGERMQSNEVQISDKRRNFLETRIKEETEKLDYFLGKLKELKGLS